MELIGYGYLCIEICLNDGMNFLFDFFINGNFLVDVLFVDLYFDYILIIYGYSDYIGDMLVIV